MASDHPLIAVVDRDPLFSEMMCALLADEGYQTTCCPSAREALRMLHNAKPNLVILDIQLEQRESGWILLELMRRVSATKNIPVLVCSADSWFLQEHAQPLRQYRCAILEKPFDLDAVLVLIRALIRSQ